MIERHEPLRTLFRADAGGTIEQVIRSASPLSITEIDLLEWDVSQREAQAAVEIQRIVSTPFNLTQGPLLRVALIRVAEQENILAIVMHHIIADGVSVNILLNEFATYYQSCTQGKPAQLAHLLIQYADYTAWQQRWLEGGKKKASSLTGKTTWVNRIRF